jgi:hypothetical protein
MQESHDQQPLVRAVAAERERLRAMLRGMAPGLLAERPPSGKWSVVENVRHLIFAEESHLGRFVPGVRTWSAVGLAPHNKAASMGSRMVGTNETTDIVAVFEAWDEVHARTCRAFQGGATLTEAMERSFDRNLRHLRAHIKVIERLLRSTP